METFSTCITKNVLKDGICPGLGRRGGRARDHPWMSQKQGIAC